MDNKPSVCLALIPGRRHAVDTVQLQSEPAVSHWQLIKVRDRNGKFRYRAHSDQTQELLILRLRARNIEQT